MLDFIATQNAAWGFYGTIKHHADPDAAWAGAVAAVAAATGCDAAAVCGFLDSRHGRHFADDVANGLSDGLALPAAINATALRWLDWTITRQESRASGIPQGMPSLIGYVIACEIAADAT